MFTCRRRQRMPKNINERYKQDKEFAERMKENSRKRYAEMKEALAIVKRAKELGITLPPAPAPPQSSSADQSRPS